MSTGEIEISLAREKELLDKLNKIEELKAKQTVKVNPKS